MFVYVRPALLAMKNHPCEMKPASPTSFQLFYVALAIDITDKCVALVMHHELLSKDSRVMLYL